MSREAKRGRPKGARNIKDVAEVVPSRCRCGSSRRSDYTNTYYRDYSDAGLPFVGIYYRTCRCLDCGQSRRDLQKVYAPAENNREPIISTEDDAVRS